MSLEAGNSPADRYSVDGEKSRRSMGCLQGAVVSLLMTTITLIGLVAWLGSSVRDAKSDIDALKRGAQAAPGVLLTQGNPAVSGYTSAGSLSRGSGFWSVQAAPIPMGGLSDHLVLPNGADSLLIVGGMNATTYFQSGLVAYDTVYETYSQLADMPVPRTRFGAAVGNGNLYVVGGFGGPTAMNDNDTYTAVQLGDLVVYNVASNKWSRTNATLATPRSDHCAAWANGKLYVIGGYDNIYNTLGSVEVFDPSSGRFSSGISLPEPRGDVGCNSIGNTILVHGGYYEAPGGNPNGGFFHTTTWALDTTNLAAGWARKADMNTPRGDHAFTALPNGRLMVIGGENGQRDTNNKVPTHMVEMYNLQYDVWSLKAPTPYARFRFGAAAVGETVYAVGGHALCLEGKGALCAAAAANTMSMFLNIEHPTVFVQLSNSN